MKTSNLENGLRLMLTQAEVDEIHDKMGMVNFWTIKQTGPLEFMVIQAEEGQGVQFTVGYGDFANSLQFSRDRPKTIASRVWGMTDVKSMTVLRQGVRFEPDMSKEPIRRSRGTEAERIHKRAEVLSGSKDDGALMSLRDFTQAVDRVNKFVTENESHVVLDVKSGLLKFLVEG